VGKKMTTENPIVSFSMPQGELDRIDDLFHKYRFKHRSYTIKWLIRLGLESNAEPNEQDLKGHIKD